MQNLENKSELNISLLNKNNDDYSKKQIDLLNNLAQNIKKSDGIKTINIKVLSERLSTEILYILKQLVQNTKSFAQINVIASHYNQNMLSSIKTWKASQILKANLYIENICKVIKEKNLTPAEALTFIHLQVENLVEYSPSANRSWCSNDQLFVGAFLDKPEFVCSGRCTLAKHIIDTLNNKNLLCDVVALTTFNTETSVKEEHARLHICLKDKKYNLDDEFYDDLTWDYIDNKESVKYAHLLMPKNCHWQNMSKYDFYNFDYQIISKSNRHYYTPFEPLEEYAQSPVKPIEQKLIEKIVFSTMAKTSSDSFENLYSTLQKMAKASFDEQQSKRYKFALKKPTLALTKQEALELYAEAKNQNALEM